MPDIVIEAIAAYLQAANANLGGAFVTSRVSDASSTGRAWPPRRFLGVYADEVIFGANTTTPQLRAFPTVAREWAPKATRSS